MQTKRILFINFGGLGDEILFLPTIESIKKEFPKPQIMHIFKRFYAKSYHDGD
jgi:ADP-heptose:LPS heptosyltransferase